MIQGRVVYLNEKISRFFIRREDESFNKFNSQKFSVAKY